MLNLMALIFVLLVFKIGKISSMEQAYHFYLHDKEYDKSIVTINQMLFLGYSKHMSFKKGNLRHALLASRDKLRWQAAQDGNSIWYGCRALSARQKSGSSREEQAKS